jgi:CheY-like chemotaxis protein
VPKTRLDRPLLYPAARRHLVNDRDRALRSVRAQTAIVRTLAAETQREGQADDSAEDLRAQAVQESARLVSAVESLSKTRSSAPPSAKDVSHPRAPLPIADCSPRVLVVEDDDETRHAIAWGLAPEYEVVAAANGLEGLKAASEQSFDAIVADIGMPEMDGITMVDRIRRMRAPAAVPVVFLTAETAPERIAEGFSAGGASYLTKPVDLELLDQELRWVLAGAHGASESES